MNSKLALVRLANLVKDNEKLVQKLVKIINEDLDDYYLLREYKENECIEE